MTHTPSHSAKKRTFSPAESHKITASHLQEAAKHHNDAAQHFENGNHEKAAHSTLKAKGYTKMAKHAQKGVLNYHLFGEVDANGVNDINKLEMTPKV